MKKRALLLLIIAILLGNSIIYELPSFAVDDATYYGDGTTAKLVDVKAYLNDVYANTPYISISTANGKEKVYFNVEYFIDLGLYAYGDPETVVQIGSMNDFKEVEDGYYVDSSSGTQIRGEYRYIGLSPTGLPVSNSRFPPEQEQVDFSELAPMKYSELSDYRKKKYNIYGVDNEAYKSIQSIIDNSTSPALAFLNEGVSNVPFSGHLQQMGYMNLDGKPAISLFEYGIIYNWSVNGGTIRMFFKSVKTGDFYCYKTFVGPVSLKFCKKAPDIEVLINTSQNKTTYVIPVGADYVDIPVRVIGSVIDNVGYLTAFERKYSFTRFDITKVDLYLNDSNVKIQNNSTDMNAAYYFGEVTTIRVYRDDMPDKVASICLVGRADVDFGGVIFSGENSITVTVVLQQKTQTPIPTIAPVHTAEPEPTKDVTSLEKQWFDAYRRW